MANMRSNTLGWQRLVAESVVVVLSILLAFSIDAWWDSRNLREREQELMQGLRTEFRAARADLEARLTLAQRMASGTAQFLDVVPSVAGPTSVTVPDSIVIALLGGPTYDPATNTLDAAVSSGEIDLLGDAQLRAELANWRRVLADTREDELVVRQTTHDQVVPLLAASVDLRTHYERVLPWSGGDPFGPGQRIAGAGGEVRTSTTTVRVTTALLGALAVRKFYVDFSAAGLEDLLAILDRIVERLGHRIDS